MNTRGAGSREGCGSIASERENSEIVRRLYEDVYSKGETNVIPKIVSSASVYHRLPSDPKGVSTKGVEAVTFLAKSFRKAFPDLRMKVDDIRAHDDMVYVRWTGTGSHKGSYFGVPPSNERCTVPGISIHRVREGLIQESWSTWDTAGLLQQIGALQMPESGR